MYFLNLSLFVALSLVAGARSQCTADFDWSSLSPSPTLNWTSCYTEPFECSRLEVPLDYNNTDGPKAAIALFRIPSAYTNSSADYRGPLLLIPGGPGGSGFDLFVQNLDILKERLGDAYDLVTFDPRGVGRSTPQAQRFPTQLSSALWGEISLADVLPALSIPGNIGLTLAKGEVTNDVYAAHAASYLPFINTPNTATDMLRIIQAYGQDKITCYAVSYGTVLGTTFATMYPDKVERMILDGVVDANAYYAGNITSQVLDSDKALDVFFETCFEAGPNSCAFYDSSPAKISANFDALFDQLRLKPLPVFVDETSYGVLDYSHARQTARNMLYFPYTYTSFPAFAEALAQAQQGNGTALYTAGGGSSSFTCECANATNPENGIDALITIQCNDAIIPDRAFEDWEAYYESAANVSQFSEILVGLAMRCSGWSISNDDKITPASIGSNTSAPLLFISNTIDPATPHVGGVKMSGLFPGSSLLTQNSTGHTSTSASSNCTTNVVKQYLADGTLPAAGTVCEVEGSIFP